MEREGLKRITEKLIYFEDSVLEALVDYSRTKKGSKKMNKDFVTAVQTEIDKRAT